MKIHRLNSMTLLPSLQMALVGATLALSCSEAENDTGTYYGYYRGGPPSSNALPTPTGTGPASTPSPSAGAGGAGQDDYPDGGAMAGEGGGDTGEGGGDMGAGGGGMETPGGDVPCDAPGMILVSRCGAASCHGGAIGDFAESASALEALVGESPDSSSADCGLMIDPDSPEDSFLLRKLTGEFPDGASCGSQMPIGTPLTPTEIECVESWISQF